MDSFAIRPTTWSVLRIFSRNPLIRRSDRIDALIVPLAFLLVIVAAACAGVLGTLAHDVESRRCSEEARTRHSVTATAVEDSVPGSLPGPAVSKVRVRWRAIGADHIDTLTWDQAVKAGTPLSIWIDENGDKVEPPTPPALAGANAVLAAAVAWWIVFLIAALAAEAARARTTRLRDAQWDRELRLLLDGEDGRTNHSQ